MEEEWRKIPGLSRYLVSNTGKVKACEKIVNYRHGKRRVKEMILRPRVTEFGYYKLFLTDDNGKKVQPCVHKLVLIAFKKAVEGKTQGNHLNGNKLDNRIDNLEWCNQSENTQHAYKTGLIKNISKTQGKWRLVSNEEKEIISRSKEYTSEIAKIYKISERMVRKIKHDFLKARGE